VDGDWCLAGPRYHVAAMKRWMIRLFVIVVIVGAGYALKLTVLAPKPIEVEVHRVTGGAVESTITNSRAGRVSVRRRSQLSPEIAGRVVELPFAEGDRVSAGDVLVRMDRSILEAQRQLTLRGLDSANSRHAETCLTSERATREFERNEKLAATNIISDDVLDKVQNARDRALLACTTSLSLVEEARSRLELAETQLTQCDIVAPFDGVLAQLQVELGEFIMPSPPGVPIPAVIDLIDLASIYISAPMDEVDSAVIEPGQVVRVTIDPYPDAEFEGRVKRIAPYVLDLQEQNRTVDIEVELLDAEFAAKLLPGTSADVEVVLEVAPDVLRIPTSALLEGGRVLLLEQGLIAERQLDVGLKNWNWTEARGGLELDDLVITSLGSTEVQVGVSALAAQE